MAVKRKMKKFKPLSARQAMLRVIKRLHQSGCEALLAGGCVRDMLLGRTPKDYDIATNAVPETVTELFGRTLTVGAQFGVVVVLVGGRQVEVATFRSDISYHDGRRPEKVVFTDARTDAERRDFTINGMFFDPLTEKVIDYVGGQKDLQKGVIRAIGDPNARFNEDHLRMLRAIRFAGRFDFSIEKATWQAMVKYASKIKRVSAERIAMELEHILVDPNRARGMHLTLESGLLKHIFTSIEPGRLEFGIEILQRLPNRCSFALVLAALLTKCEPKTVSQICRDLRASNDLRKQTRWLVENRTRLLENMPLTKGRLKKWLAEPLFEPLMLLERCYLNANNQSDAPLRQLRRQIKKLGDEPIVPPRLLDGHELIRLGAAPGPMVGRLAEELYLVQLENQVKTKTQARQWVKKWLAKHQDESPC